MQKKNVLGTDPLSWLKEKDKIEKTESSDNCQKEPVNNQTDTEEADRINAKSKMQETKASDMSYIENAFKKSKHKPADVSMSEKQQLEDTYYEPRDVSNIHLKKGLAGDAYSYHDTSREAVQKENPATMFVIVYTVLLLILGFIVYRDLTRQIDKLNTKLTNLEKQIDAGIIYEDN